MENETRYKKTHLTPYVCVYCGVTSLDGAPDLGVPYPEVIDRGMGELLCSECWNEVLKEEEENETKRR